jgi:hypothetical protein
MSNNHTIILILDDASGTLTVEHRCATTIGEHTVRHSEPVTIAEPAAALTSLKALIDANREKVESKTTDMAIQHVAAVNNLAKKNQTIMHLSGSITGIGKIS